ncbi:thioesterase family protein [Cytophagales bacterium LB-30]|uniref:Thioesterase family protein n=1 Tax=Shiella aurantiaca TaxID=3058365 RepID=A0ABT8F7Z5_9BACT|nr:thioesterase family protein [Shiella aurantiaca]MDN4166359.1 thioesterase family protein [Shiella aurantiaca]
MFTHSTYIRVRYAETDKMGFVYYGNYSTYYEVARVESMRHLGINYKTMEDEGILMPVIENSSRYIKPALYDDLLEVRLRIEKLPSVKIQFHYEIYNEAEVLLHTGTTTLVFLDTQTRKTVAAPSYILDKLSPYFDEVSHN